MSDETAPKVEELTDQEKRWIAKCVATSMEWTKSEDLPTLDQLEELAIRRMAEPENATASIDVIAMAIGEHIRRGSDLAWKVVTDEYGTTLALYRSLGHIVVAPQSMVSKRWTFGQPFVVSLVTQTIAHLEQIAAEIAASQLN